MAKYQITHSCGHDQTHQIYGTNVNGERERKAGWLAGSPCTDCWKKGQDEQLAAEAKAAAEANADLPGLTGSEKQIAWAETIRAKANASITQSREFTLQNAAKNPQIAEIASGIINDLMAKTDSRYWIDNRDIIFDLKWVASETEKAMDK